MGVTEPKRVLVVRNDRLGDTILSLPVVPAIRQLLPSSHVTWLSHVSVAPIVQQVAGIDDLLLDDGTSGSVSLAAQLRQHQFDAALVLNTNTRNAQAVWRAGIGKRVLWNGKLAGRLLGNSNVKLRRSHPPVHESRFALAFVSQLVGKPVYSLPAPPSLRLPPSLLQRVAQRLGIATERGRPLFAVHPGNRNSAFNWPTYRYAELVRGLARFGHVLVTGGPGEESLVEQVIQLAGDHGQPVVGLSLLEFAALTAQVSVLIVSSTGPMHLAGWLQTPIVCLFSRHPAQVPEKWAPLGNRHTIIQPALAVKQDAKLYRQPEQMERIETEPVLKAALAWLDESRLGRTG